MCGICGVVSASGSVEPEREREGEPVPQPGDRHLLHDFDDLRYAATQRFRVVETTR